MTQPSNCNTEPTCSMWSECLEMNAWALARLANQPTLQSVPVFLSLFQLTASHWVAFVSSREKQIQTENKTRRKARTTSRKNGKMFTYITYLGLHINDKYMIDSVWRFFSWTNRALWNNRTCLINQHVVWSVFRSANFFWFFMDSIAVAILIYTRWFFAILVL